VPRQDTQHGIRSMYVNGCRCEPCTQANRVYQLERYHLRKGSARAAAARIAASRLAPTSSASRLGWEQIWEQNTAKPVRISAM
jgi:hypothetical protein